MKNITTDEQIKRDTFISLKKIIITNHEHEQRAYKAMMKDYKPTRL